MTPQDQAHVAEDQVTAEVRAQTCASLLAKNSKTFGALVLKSFTFAWYTIFTALLCR